MQNMKNTIFKLVVVAIAVFGLVSCEKYLNRTPLDSNSDATNWTSASALKSFSWRLYNELGAFSYGPGGGSWTRGQYHGETMTDDYTPSTFPRFTEVVPTSSSSWNNPYDQIRLANVLLARVDQVEGISEADANHWRGVARFFRALWHFQLVKTYGDVVWVEEEVDFSKEENVTRPRDSRVTVMDNVVADLTFAMNNCYAPDKADANTVNSMVAAALLSRAALYEGAWEKYHAVSGGHPNEFYTAAKNAANNVISSNSYEVINGKYKELYNTIDLNGNKEILLYKVYTHIGSAGATINNGHATGGWSASSDPTWGLTKSAVENYAKSNGLPIHMDASYDDSSIEGVFTGRDKRLAGAVCDTIAPVNHSVFVDGIWSNTGYWTWKFVPLERYDAMIANGTWNAPNNDTDGPIFTYAEVLENYAEACAELGSISQADLDKSVNLLRVRHGGIPALTLAGDAVSVNGTVITKDPKDKAANVLLQELRRDRRSELMADGFRHDDLMRWKLGENLDFTKNPDGYLGANISAIKAYHDKIYKRAHPTASAADIAADWETVKGATNWVGNYISPFYSTAVTTPATSASGAKVNRVWSDTYYLEPIPAGQRLLDENLGQNPGW